MGSGNSLYTNLTSFGYACSTCSISGVTRAQNGHWKSENSIMTTGASAGPLTGDLPTGRS